MVHLLKEGFSGRDEEGGLVRLLHRDRGLPFELERALPVDDEVRRLLRLKGDLEVPPGADDVGARREHVGRERHEEEPLDQRVDDRPSRAHGVGGRPGRGGYEQAVGPESFRRRPIDVDAEPEHLRRPVGDDDRLVEGVAKPSPVDGEADPEPPLDRERGLIGGEERTGFVGLQVREEPHLAPVDPKDRDLLPHLVDGEEDRPVAADDHDEVARDLLKRDALLPEVPCRALLEGDVVPEGFEVPGEVSGVAERIRIVDTRYQHDLHIQTTSGTR